VYFSGEGLLACEEAGITIYLPKPMTSGVNAKGRFGKQGFVYVAEDDVYLCPAGEQLTYHYTNEEDGKTLRRYWTTACQACALKSKCTTGKERRISRWEHEAVLEAVQARLDRNPDKMRVRRQTVEHPFGTIKSWMGSTHFQMKTLKHVSTEMALHVLAYNMKRVMSISWRWRIDGSDPCMRRASQARWSRLPNHHRVFTQPGPRTDLVQCRLLCRCWRKTQYRGLMKYRP
jgi:hypothetical protein